MKKVLIHAAVGLVLADAHIRCWKVVPNGATFDVVAVYSNGDTEVVKNKASLADANQCLEAIIGEIQKAYLDDQADRNDGGLGIAVIDDF